jgi:hypothetical protein
LTFITRPHEAVTCGFVPENRPPIPRPLERELFIEAGYRCAIPTCRVVAPLQIDHIEDWAKVREHKFENMIVLCANCHGRKGSGRGQIDRLALRQYKANLSLLNHRYGEFERRILDYFVASSGPPIIFLPGGMDLLVHYLVSDGYLVRADVRAPMTSNFRLKHVDGTEMTINIPNLVGYFLTESGAEFVKKWQEAKPLDDAISG